MSEQSRGRQSISGLTPERLNGQQGNRSFSELVLSKLLTEQNFVNVMGVVSFQVQVHIEG